MLGSGRIEAMCFDGQKRLCKIRGKLRKKVWINVSDIVLVGLRDYQDGKADVILKYSSDEVNNAHSAIDPFLQFVDSNIDKIYSGSYTNMGLANDFQFKI